MEVLYGFSTSIKPRGRGSTINTILSLLYYLIGIYCINTIFITIYSYTTNFLLTSGDKSMLGSYTPSPVQDEIYPV